MTRDNTGKIVLLILPPGEYVCQNIFLLTRKNDFLTLCTREIWPGSHFSLIGISSFRQDILITIEKENHD